MAALPKVSSGPVSSTDPGRVLVPRGSYYRSQGAMLVSTDPSVVRVVVWRRQRLDPGVWKLGTPGRLRSPQEGPRILLEHFASKYAPVEPPSLGRTGRAAPT